jgi:MFS family permease
MSEAPTREPTALEEWRRGWPLVLTSALGMSLATIYLTSAGVVMKPLHDAFGWSRGQISVMMAIKSTALILSAPFIGYAVDRFGARRVALPGVLLYLTAIAAAGLTGPGIWSWWAVWTFAAVGGVMVGSTIWTSAVVKRFNRHRGLALGFTMAGLGLTASVVPPLAVWSLQAFGWRGMYFTLAGVAFVVVFPLVWLFFREPDRVPIADNVPPPPLVGYTFKEAIRQPRYWRIAAAFLVGSVGMGVFQVHLFPMITDTGISPMKAAGYVALLGPLAIAGRIGGGFLMDRIHVSIVGGLSFGLPIINCFLIPHMTTIPGAIAIVVAITGLAVGAESDVTGVLVSRYFGMRNYGQTYAVITCMFAVGSGWASALGGFIFDRTGNYDLVLKIVAACLLVSVILLVTVGRYPILRAPDPETAKIPAA